MRDDFRLVWLIVCIAMALVLCISGLGVAQLLGRMFRSTGTTITALDYALTMKNTGLALALASNVLVDQHVLLLPVFTTTLVQHLFASALHRSAIRRNGLVPEVAKSTEGNATLVDSAEARP
jgi:predicted Na+-dependent transporter